MHNQKSLKASYTPTDILKNQHRSQNSLHSIITEENSGQYYPDYAYNHALFTNDMKVYSDSKVSGFLRDVTADQRIQFLNEWNSKRDHRERIYISYDSTNKKSQAGKIEMVELGHTKESMEEEIINFPGASTQTPQERLPPAKQERGIHPNLAALGISLYASRGGECTLL